MFPEDDIAREFWVWVHERACDARTSAPDEVPLSETLDAIEARRSQIASAGLDFMRVDKTRSMEADYEIGFPVVYPTLQDALLAFLICLTAENGSLRVIYVMREFEMWLRVVVLVVACAQKEPELLTQQIHIHSGGDPERPELVCGSHTAERAEHTMTLDGEWSCLSHQTFDYIQRRYINAR